MTQPEQQLAYQEWAKLITGGYIDGTTYEAQVRYVKVLRYLLKEDRTALIADIGCGTGAYLQTLAKLGFTRLIGVDITRAHMAAARRNCPEAMLVVADGSRLPFKQNVLDLLTSTGSIEHYVNPERGLAEFARVCRGRLVISSDCYTWRILQVLGVYKSRQPVDRAINPIRLLKMFSRHGMKPVHFEAWGITHYRRFFRKVAKVLRRLLRLSDKRSEPKPVPESAYRIGKQRAFSNTLKMFILDENVFYLEKKTPS